MAGADPISTRRAMRRSIRPKCGNGSSSSHFRPCRSSMKPADLPMNACRCGVCIHCTFQPDVLRVILTSPDWSRICLIEFKRRSISSASNVAKSLSITIVSSIGISRTAALRCGVCFCFEVLDLLRFSASCDGSLDGGVPRSESSGGEEDRWNAIRTLPGLFSNSPNIQIGPSGPILLKESWPP
jgi:hypothetical protein